MCSQPFGKTTKIEEILSDKTIIHSLTLKDFNQSQILMPSKSKLKTRRSKVNQNKQPNQFIYVQDNPETKINKNKI